MKPSTKHQRADAHRPTAAGSPPPPNMAREADRRTPRSLRASALFTLSKLLARQAAAEFLLSVASPMGPVLAGAAS